MIRMIYWVSVLLMMGVSATAQTSGRILYVPGNYATIAAAVAASQAGDTIRVSPGVYPVTGLTMPNFVVHIESTGGSTFTTLTGNNATQRMLLYMNGNANGRLKGFTITGGRGGALQIDWGASPTVENCVFVRNQTPNNGGAIYMNNQVAPIIRSCQFTGNMAGQLGGAIAVYGNSTPQLSGNTYQQNSANGNAGGAAYIKGSTPTLTGEIFTRNSAALGGGLFLDGCAGTVSQCRFEQNSAIQSGGGILIQFSTTAVLDCAILDNTGSNTAYPPCRNSSRKRGLNRWSNSLPGAGGTRTRRVRWTAYGKRDGRGSDGIRRGPGEGEGASPRDGAPEGRSPAG
ncbi:MAG: right-handed parallel beta-helix repeat-containing protein [Armatimonadetes bacterium]|nr:right-handed parallel beta-helix repeat-containing protein [Armatimonadota bacterium]